MSWRRKTDETDVVARVRAQVEQAAALAQVGDQGLLDDPRLNPETRPYADDLRVREQHRALDQEHRRTVRRDRVRDGRAEYAAKALELIQDARDARSPARTVVEVTRARGRFTVGALGASVLLSIGSAMGLEALAASWGAPAGVGYLAEVGLTGLSTTAIVWTGMLDRHQGRAAGGRSWALVALIAVPLIASIVGSTAGSGPVGAACSLGAAAFAALAYLVSTTSADAVRGAVARMDATDEDDLRRQALDLTEAQQESSAVTTEVEEPPGELEGELEELPVARAVSRAAMDAAVEDPALRDLMFAAITREMGEDGDDDGDGTGGSDRPEQPPSGPLGGRERRPVAHAEPRTQGAHGVAQGLPTDAQGGAHPAQVIPEATPEAVRAYARAYPDQSKASIARRFQISRRSVGRYLDDTPTSGGGDS